MIGIAEAFSPRYAQARQKFLQGCVSAGLSVEPHAHPLKGRDGEDLSMDVALDGDANAQNLLICRRHLIGHCLGRRIAATGRDDQR